MNEPNDLLKLIKKGKKDIMLLDNICEYAIAMATWLVCDSTETKYLLNKLRIWKRVRIQYTHLIFITCSHENHIFIMKYWTAFHAFFLKNLQYLLSFPHHSYVVFFVLIVLSSGHKNTNKKRREKKKHQYFFSERSNFTTKLQRANFFSWNLHYWLINGK